MAAAARYKYLFDGVKPEKWHDLIDLLDDIDKAAAAQVDRTIFDKP